VNAPCTMFSFLQPKIKKIYDISEDKGARPSRWIR
jgi:hypothetical protein